MAFKRIKNYPQTSRKPDLVLKFEAGDYNDSLKHYISATEWAIETKQYSVKTLCGIINRPSHPESPSDSLFVPKELVNDPQWAISVDFYFTDEETLIWVKGLDIPEGAAWQ